MVISLLKYINDNFSFKENVDTCISELKALDEFIVNSFIEDLAFSDAIELLKKSDILMNIFNYLVKSNSEDLKNMYHNNLSISTLFMAYSEINKFNLDVFLYGQSGSRNRKLLSNEEVKSLTIRIKSGDEAARTVLYEHNIGLIRRIASIYSRNYKVEFEDLMQQGSLGLLDAIERFDYTLGYRFSTYATWWIRQEINRYCEDNCNTIRIPSHMRQLINKVRRLRSQIYSDTGMYPDNSELAGVLGVPEEKIKEVLEIKTDGLVSLEQKIADEKDGTELGDFVADDSLDPAEEVVNNISSAKLLKVVDDVLTPREKQVILYRMGFYGKIYTLEEVGNMYGVTRERIRQIEAKALRKLKKPAVKRKLETSEHSPGIQDIPSIKKYFPNYSLDQIRLMITYLPDNQRELVYKMFGRDLKDYYALGPSDIHNFKNGVVPNLKRLLNGETLKKEPVSILEEFSDYSKDEIFMAILKLPEKQRRYIYSRYGNDLEGNNIITANESKYLVGIILPKLGRILRGEENVNKKSIFDWFPEYRKEEVIEAVKKLPANERTLVYQRYGENLDDFVEGMPSANASFLRSTIRSHISKILRGEEVAPKSLSVFDWFPDYSKEDVMRAIELLPTKQKSSIYERFGKQLNENHTNVDASYLRTTVRTNIEKIIKGETIEVNSSMLSLVELFADTPRAKLYKAFRELSFEEIGILRLKYGENYDEVLTVPNEINTAVSKIKKKLNKIIDSFTDKRKNLYDLIGLDKKIVDLRINCLSDDEKEALYAYYGYDLENPAGEIFDEELLTKVEMIIIPKLKRPTNEERTFVNKIRLIADKLHNDKKLLSFSEDEIVVGYLINYYSMDGNYQYILSLLDMKEDLLKRMLKYMDKKHPFAIKYIGDLVDEYMFNNNKKDAVYS